jgi:hypothetical protein
MFAVHWKGHLSSYLVLTALQSSDEASVLCRFSGSPHRVGTDNKTTAKPLTGRAQKFQKSRQRVLFLICRDGFPRVFQGPGRSTRVLFPGADKYAEGEAATKGDAAAHSQG